MDTSNAGDCQILEKPILGIKATAQGVSEVSRGWNQMPRRTTPQAEADWVGRAGEQDTNDGPEYLPRGMS